MAERPQPVRDLDWETGRARELGEAAVDLWTELLDRLRELPVGRDFEVEAVALRGDAQALDRLNEQVMTAIHTDGRVYCSNAVVDGRFCLRACIVNFRTEAEELETLLTVAAEHGSCALASASL